MSDDSAKTEFRRDPETGLLMAYRDGTLVGPIIGMGDFPGPRDLRRVRCICQLINGPRFGLKTGHSHSGNTIVVGGDLGR